VGGPSGRRWIPASTMKRVTWHRQDTSSGAAYHGVDPHERSLRGALRTRARSAEIDQESTRDHERSVLRIGVLIAFLSVTTRNLVARRVPLRAHKAKQAPPRQAPYEMTMKTQCENNAIRMMIGIGTPRSRRRIERMGFLLTGQRSRRRPPWVASKLAEKAPSSKETKSHRAA
jgi:hypothetical protein